MKQKQHWAVLLVCLAALPISAQAIECKHPCQLAQADAKAMAKPKMEMSAEAKAAKAAIDAAEAARKKAASVDSEWRDVSKFITQAKAALDKGEYDKAVKLASMAKEQGELGYQQAMAQQEVRVPAVLKYK